MYTHNTHLGKFSASEVIFTWKIILYCKDFNSRVMFVPSLIPKSQTLFPLLLNHICLSLVLSCTFSGEQLSNKIAAIKASICLHLFNRWESSFVCFCLCLVQ